MHLFSNLHKWQAVSHNDLSNAPPEILFDAEFAQKYHELHSDIWRRITRLHGTIHTLSQLDDFPLDYFYAPGNMEFWRLVFENFGSMVIVLLDGLVNDDGSDTHTLQSFKNDCIKAKWKDEKFREILFQVLREREFNDKHEDIRARVKKIRNNYIAHRLKDKLSGLPRHDVESVSLSEVRVLFEAIHDLFGALSFGSAYITLAGDLMPATVGGPPARSCLDLILDEITKAHPGVHQPENDPWWKDIRPHVSENELRSMNLLRRRIGLPEA